MFNLSNFKKPTKKTTFSEKVCQALELGAETRGAGRWTFGMVDNAKFDKGNIVKGEKSYAFLGLSDTETGHEKGRFIQGVYTVLASIKSVSDNSEKISKAVFELSPDTDGETFQNLLQITPTLCIVATKQKNNWTVAPMLSLQFRNNIMIGTNDIPDISELWQNVKNELDEIAIAEVDNVNNPK